jgi:hypothetical protein
LCEAEKRQFEVGLRTSTDVLDAQAKFANAQIDLAYATGMFLGAYKIRWEPIVPSAGKNASPSQSN